MEYFRHKIPLFTSKMTMKTKRAVKTCQKVREYSYFRGESGGSLKPRYLPRVQKFVALLWLSQKILRKIDKSLFAYWASNSKATSTCSQ